MSVQEDILAEIKAFDTIIIHRHKRPDPDALGSQVGLAELLRASFLEKKFIKWVGLQKAWNIWLTCKPSMTLLTRML